MGRFIKGEVVVLPFPFSDLSSSKKRPALVITALQSFDDVILCMITSKNVKDETAISLRSADFEIGSLPKESNIRPNRLFTANASIILRSAGKLSPEKLEQVLSSLVEIIRN